MFGIYIIQEPESAGRLALPRNSLHPTNPLTFHCFTWYSPLLPMSPPPSLPAAKSAQVPIMLYEQWQVARGSAQPTDHPHQAQHLSVVANGRSTMRNARTNLSEKEIGWFFSPFTMQQKKKKKEKGANYSCPPLPPHLPPITVA